MTIIRKEVIAPGVIWCEDENGNARAHSFRRKDVLHFYREGRGMLRRGLAIPAPIEHQSLRPITRAAIDQAADQLRNNGGWVRNYLLLNGKLFADIEVTDPVLVADAESKSPAKVRWVSPEIHPGFIDPTTGKRLENVITHVAFTLRPRHAGQTPYIGKEPVPTTPEQKAIESMQGEPEPWAASLNRPVIRLSMADALVKGERGWRPVEPARFAWQPFTYETKKGTAGIGAVNPATGSKLYGERAKRALASKRGQIGVEKTSPRPAAHPVPPQPPTKAAEARSESSPAPQPPAGEGKKPKKEIEFTQEHHELTVPAYRGLAQRIKVPEGEKLGPKAHAATVEAYKAWRQQFPNASDFIRHLQASYDYDQAQEKEGKQPASGSSWGARALAYRSMLDWANQEHDAEERNEIKDYQRRLEVPVEDRMRQIESKRVQSSSRVKSGGEVFADHVISSLIASGAVRGLSEKEFDPNLYEAARHGGTWTRPLTAAELAHNADHPNEQIKPLPVTLSGTVRPQDYVRTADENIFKAIKAGKIGDDDLEMTLAALSRVGVGTLSVKEFKDRILPKATAQFSLLRAASGFRVRFNRARVGHAR